MSHKKRGPDRWNRWMEVLFHCFEMTQLILACFTFAWGAIRLWRFLRKP